MEGRDRERPGPGERGSNFRACRACEKQPYRSGVAHGSRRAFRIIVVEQARASPGLTLSHFLPRYPIHVRRASLTVSVSSLHSQASLRGHLGGNGVLSRQDYPVNNAPNSSPRSILHYCKTFPCRSLPFRLLRRNPLRRERERTLPPAK